MKTAISIPDPLFNAAENMSRRLGMSRSRFYTRALEEFVKSLGVKDAVDAVYGSEDSKLDPALQAAQSASFAKEEW